jgi:hypothetical protein
MLSADKGSSVGWGALGAGDVAAIRVSLASIKRLVRGAFPLKKSLGNVALLHQTVNLDFAVLHITIGASQPGGDHDQGHVPTQKLGQ